MAATTAATIIDIAIHATIAIATVAAPNTQHHHRHHHHHYRRCSHSSPPTITARAARGAERKRKAKHIRGFYAGRRGEPNLLPRADGPPPPPPPPQPSQTSPHHHREHRQHHHHLLMVLAASSKSPSHHHHYQHHHHDQVKSQSNTHAIRACRQVHQRRCLTPDASVTVLDVDYVRLPFAHLDMHLSSTLRS